MAKIKNGLFSSEAHGTIGDLLTFTSGKNGARAIRKPRTSGNTPIQTKAKFAQLCADWNDLSTELKNSWALIGAVSGVTGFNAFIADGMQAAAPVYTYATWNPADIGSHVSLSNSNLTAALNANLEDGVLARATIGLAAGRHCWEITVDSTPFLCGIGLALATAPYTYIGSTGDSFGWLSDGFGFAGTPTHSGTFPSFIAGDVVTIAFDADAHTCEWFRNGTSVGSASAIPAGVWIPAVSFYSISGQTMTANFGQSALAHPQSGFASGVFAMD